MDLRRDPHDAAAASATTWGGTGVPPQNNPPLKNGLDELDELEDHLSPPRGTTGVPPHNNPPLKNSLDELEELEDHLPPPRGTTE
eukprot:1832138-Heterocapsa_arctica.AAC.1